MDIFKLLLLVLKYNIENHTVEKCKHKTVIFTKVCKYSTKNVTNLHKFNSTGISKIASYGNSFTTFACLILARNYNSPRNHICKSYNCGCIYPFKAGFH